MTVRDTSTPVSLSFECLGNAGALVEGAGDGGRVRLVGWVGWVGIGAGEGKGVQFAPGVGCRVGGGLCHLRLFL